MAVVVKTNGIPFWLVGEFTTHFRTYFSGGLGANRDFDPWPHSRGGGVHSTSPVGEEKHTIIRGQEGGGNFFGGEDAPFRPAKGFRYGQRRTRPRQP